jgi:hypothetical protein
MAPLTRRERKLLHELASLAYERELGGEIARLELVFTEWRVGRRSPHEVSTAIHEFHDGVARDLYGLYTRIEPAHAVGRAIAVGLLGEGEVNAELRAKLESAVEFYRSQTATAGADAPAIDRGAAADGADGA